MNMTHEKEPTEDIFLIAEVASKYREPQELTEGQVSNLENIDKWIGDIFPKMETEHKEAHSITNYYDLKSHIYHEKRKSEE